MGPAFSSDSNCFYKMHTICNYRAEGTGNPWVRISQFSHAFTFQAPIVFQLLLLVLQILEEHRYFYQSKDFQQWLFRKTIYRVGRRGLLVIRWWCRVSYFCVEFWLYYLLPVIWGPQLGIFYPKCGIHKIRSCIL